MLFPDVQIICEDKTFTISVYRKLTISGAFTHFDSFLPSTCKFGIVHTLSYRCFPICSCRTKLHTEIVCLKKFHKKWLPQNLINKSFKRFMNNIYVIKETTLTVEKKPLFPVLPYLNAISFTN